MAVQAGLCLAWSETPKDMFVVAHIFFFFYNPNYLIFYAIV